MSENYQLHKTVRNLCMNLWKALIRPWDLTKGVAIQKFHSHITELAKLEASLVLWLPFRHNCQKTVLSLHSPEAVQKELSKDNVLIVIMYTII